MGGDSWGELKSMSKFAFAAAAVILLAAAPGVAAPNSAQAWRCADAAGHAAHYKLGASEIRFWRAAIRKWSDNWCEESGATCRAAGQGVDARGEDWTVKFDGTAALMVSTDAADENLTCTAISGDPA